MKKHSKRIVFFDRDGTLNLDFGHTHKIDDFKWIPGAYEALIFCKSRGLKVVVVTNQSGVARGFFSEIDVENFHNYLNSNLPSESRVDAFYFCPHHPKGAIQKYSIICECRKPAPGLILKALNEFQMSPKEAIMIGNSRSDVQAGKNAGVDSYLFDLGSLFDLVVKIVGE